MNAPLTLFAVYVHAPVAPGLYHSLSSTDTCQSVADKTVPPFVPEAVRSLNRPQCDGSSMAQPLTARGINSLCIAV
mgnify:CR=1 FL=1